MSADEDVVARRVVRVHVHAEHPSVPQAVTVAGPVDAAVDHDIRPLRGRSGARERPRLSLDVDVIENIPGTDAVPRAALGGDLREDADDRYDAHLSRGSAPRLRVLDVGRERQQWREWRVGGVHCWREWRGSGATPSVNPKQARGVIRMAVRRAYRCRYSAYRWAGGLLSPPLCDTR
eukprot:7385807-Prymnesium_polylepis.2